MRISKTMFKEYTRCPRVCALDDLYMKRLQTSVSLYNDEDKFDIIELLGSMFDVETGDDLIDVTSPQLEALLPYYNQLEIHAMEVAEKKFGKNIIFSLETNEQKSFSFKDGKNQFYCYLDGFQETEDEVRVFEVKATTSNNFTKLGPRLKGKQHSIFALKDNVLKLDKNSEIDKDKFLANYEKLFDRYSDVGKYVFDLAVERFIIENSRKQNKLYQGKDIKYYLVVLNSNYIFDGGDEGYKPDINNNELITFVDLTLVTAEYQREIYLLKEELVKFLDKLDANKYPLGRYCERKRQSQCRFINTCWKEALEPGSIFEYTNNHHGFKDDDGQRVETIDLINMGFYKIDSIPISYLHRPNNLIERKTYELDKEYIDVEKITKGLKTLEYPLYYLDFETFPSPLPRFVGESPYSQSVFQYSLHVEKKPGVCDIDKDHFEYLAPDEDDHRLSLVEKLISDIDLSNGGTVIVYNKAFEQTRLKEFARLFPQYKNQLDKINKHIFDLLYLVSTNRKFYQGLGFSLEDSKKNNYYHKDLQGSYSIKKVLPIFSDLSYDELNVASGTEAIAAYAKFNDLSEEDLEQVRADLIDYCKQDTWAMVVILWGLYKKVGVVI